MKLSDGSVEFDNVRLPYSAPAEVLNVEKDEVTSFIVKETSKSPVNVPEVPEPMPRVVTFNTQTEIFQQKPHPNES